MFRGSWDITSQLIIKTLHREIAAGVPTPRVAPHRKWVETLIGFNATDCPKSMAGTGQLPLLVSLTIANVKLHHVLIDGGAALNHISLGGNSDWVRCHRLPQEHGGRRAAPAACLPNHRQH
jgi:hypothetical protein